MSDFFKKLNTLVKASIHDLLGDDSGAPRRKPSIRDMPDERDIGTLRQRINEALTYEDELAARVQALQAEIAQWDSQADEAVAAGREEAGRYAIQQMQLAQQRLAMAESDLREHQLVTQELILRVNELEAAVADARRAQETEAADPDAEVAQSRLERAVGERASHVLRDMREKINEMGDLISARGEVAESASVEQQVSDVVDEKAVEDDLARRRDRLSKK